MITFITETSDPDVFGVVCTRHTGKVKSDVVFSVSARTGLIWQNSVPGEPFTDDSPQNSLFAVSEEAWVMKVGTDIVLIDARTGQITSQLTVPGSDADSDLVYANDQYLVLDDGGGGSQRMVAGYSYTDGRLTSVWNMDWNMIPQQNLDSMNSSYEFSVKSDQGSNSARSDTFNFSGDAQLRREFSTCPGPIAVKTSRVGGMRCIDAGNGQWETPEGFPPDVTNELRQQAYSVTEPCQTTCLVDWLDENTLVLQNYNMIFVDVFTINTTNMKIDEKFSLRLASGTSVSTVRTGPVIWSYQGDLSSGDLSGGLMWYEGGNAKTGKVYPNLPAGWRPLAVTQDTVYACAAIQGSSSIVCDPDNAVLRAYHLKDMAVVWESVPSEADLSQTGFIFGAQHIYGCGEDSCTFWSIS